MPFDYERDDARRRAVFTFRGEFREAEGLEVLERSRLEGVGSYGFLYDLRLQEGSPTMEELRAFAKLESATVAEQGSRGAVAIVTNNSKMYRMACVYAALAAPNLSIRVFRELSDADHWLAAQSA